jgi:hypothetical protein
MESVDELDREIAEEEANEELMKDENFDDAEFAKFEQGELDLPEDSDYDQSESDELESDLDDYYKEIGIDPEEMRPTKVEKPEPVYKTEKKQKPSKSAVLEQMMATAR